MCGLAGVMASTATSPAELKDMADRMIATIVHRGPDDRGIWVDPAAALVLGFRRLSIIDLSELGHQPMSSPSGRFTLVFNGEVYNHGELRAVLVKDGWSFRGHSDTEVIAAACERWGIEAAVQRFIGMFAIAAWDGERRELSLVRDRLGIKPLFYCCQPEAFSFGSELKAVMAGPRFDRALDVDAVAEYLRYLYVPAPRSIFASVRKLEPGHILTIAPGETTPRIKPYWTLADVYRSAVANPFRGTDAEAVDELAALLSDSVRLRMQADVPWGALLSGGIDSSVVVALMQANSSRPTRTYSIGFDREEYNEAPHARLVAEHLGTDHTELLLSADDALALVPRLPDLFDEPFADPSQMPTYLVCQLARREVTVALTGDGGDEVFAGYNRYLHGEKLIPRLLGWPRPARTLAAAVAGSFGSATWDRVYGAVGSAIPAGARQRLAGEKISKLGSLLREDSAAAMYRSLMSAWQDPERLLQRGPHQDALHQALSGDEQMPLLDRMQLADQGSYLADDLLAKVDRASMAVSLEARVPLLDHRVVEFAWRLPRRHRVRDGRGKWILRQVLYRLVPRDLVERPKMGFSVPMAAWLHGPLRQWGRELVFANGRQRAVLRMDEVQRVWKSFENGRDETALPLWTILMLLAWMERWNA